QYRGIPYTCTHPFLDTSAQAMELTQISFSRHNSSTLRIQTIGGQYDRLDCCEMDSCETARYSLFRSQPNRVQFARLRAAPSILHINGTPGTGRLLSPEYN